MASGESKSPDVRPDPVPEPSLPLVKQSTAVTLTSGVVKHFPSLQDYVDQLSAQGIVKNVHDLIQKYSHLIGEMFINWLSTGQVACLFAVKLARKPRENRWIPIVQLKPLEQGSKLGAILNEQLDAVAKAGNEAAILIFPELTTGKQLVDLINLLCLCESGRWYWTIPSQTESSAVSLVGLRWILPSGGCVNYVLGFGNFDPMPITRRGPFTALFLRIVEEKRAPQPETEDGRMVVHLADLDSLFGSQEFHDIILEKTQQQKTLFIAPEKKFSARAKITFALSSEDAKHLCSCKEVTVKKVDTDTAPA